jgi:uncharacterized membrane protein YfcA
MIDLFPLDASIGQLIFLGAFTLVIAFIAGMVGVALGAVRLPVMFILGFNPVIAAGTNIGVTILGGAAASWPHWREGRVVGRVVLVIGLPAIIGSLLGGFFADGVKSWVLLTLIAALLGLSSAISLFQWWIVYKKFKKSKREFRFDSAAEDSRGVGLTARNQFLHSAIGLTLGIIAGAAGLILAGLRFPVLINVLRMGPRHAAGTNNAIGVLAATFGFFGHVINMNFDVALLAVMGVTGMVGSYFGAKQTGKVNAVTMRLIIALMLSLSTPLVVVRIFVEYPN